MAKILVVDDEFLLRAMLKDALEEVGHAVVMAENGRTALARAKTDSPDCILLDIMMPDLDGYDTCAALKAEPGTAAIPVILISATTDAKVVERARQAGAATILPKPVGMQRLQDTLAQVLSPPRT